MRDHDFDQLLEKWASYETASAPELVPTADMRQAVAALKQARRPATFFRRWLAHSVAAAALLVLAVIYPVIFRSRPGPPAWLGRELEIVGVREMPHSKKGAAPERALEKGADLLDAGRSKRGKKGRPDVFKRVELQAKVAHPAPDVTLDLRDPREEILGLTSSDAYRLVLEPAEDIHTYVFQLSPTGVLIRLFPNEVYSSYENPLGRDLVFHLPPEPKWFYLGPEGGEERLYVLASPEPLGDLDRLYAEYTGQITRGRRQAVLADLIETMDTMVAREMAHVSGWMFTFQHR